MTDTQAKHTPSHTPEPWYRAKDRMWTMQGVGADRDGRPCTILQGNYNFDDAEANEDRAIACTNACSGMADPAAEIAALREAVRLLGSNLFNNAATSGPDWAGHIDDKVIKNDIAWASVDAARKGGGR